MAHEWYEIRVEGTLPGGWSNWFEGLDVRCEPGGETVLAGPLAVIVAAAIADPLPRVAT